MIASLFAAMTLAAEAPAPAEGVFAPPDWVRRPTEMETLNVYPLKQGLLGIEGKVEITCTVSLESMLENCRVTKEEPEGEGFGAAALRLSKVMRIKPGTLDGKPIADLSVTVPVNFNTGGAASPNLPSLTESLACLSRFSARAKADPADTESARGAQWARYFANKLMKFERMSKEARDKRLDAAAAKAPKSLDRTDQDARCEKAFLPD
ncbi:MAG: TonB family protein [Pseudomonadota bacterium]